MSRFFPPRHGRTHAQGGSDPIPVAAGAVTFGEAYKTANQTIGNQSYTKITSWLNWNVPTPAVIDEATTGLVAVVDGYYALHGYLSYTGVSAVEMQFQGVFEWGAGEPFVDRLAGDPQLSLSTLVLNTDSIWTGVAFVEAGSTVEMWTEQVNAASASKTVTSAYMRMVYLCDAASGFPGF